MNTNTKTNMNMNTKLNMKDAKIEKIEQYNNLIKMILYDTLQCLVATSYSKLMNWDLGSGIAR